MKKIIVIALFVALLMLSGCLGEKTVVVEPTATPAAVNKNTIETLAIYSINSDTMTLVPVSVKKEETDLSSSYVAHLVLKNLNEEDIRLTDVFQKDKKVIVSFDAEGKPVKNCSAKMETLILEAFANSLLDNVNNCEKVIFRCNGKAYKSSQYTFGKNEVFTSE